MPSFLELLQSSSGDDDRPSSPSSAPDGVVPLDVLATVKHEGGRRRRRRQRRNLAMSGLAAIAVAVPAFALLGGDGDPAEDVRSTELADAPRTTVDDDDDRPAATTTTTSAPTEVLGVVIERPAEEAPGATTTPTTARPRPATTTPPTPPPTTAPPLVCSNSVDPACGEFRWSPDPGNAPATISTAEVLELTPGQATTITVDWSDGDAGLRFEHFSTDGTLLAGGCVVEPRYGPWTPPPANPGSGTLQYAYTAPAEPGTYTLGVSIGTGDCSGPYVSEAQRLITVNVVEAPAP
jgi:hypothetical protein